MVIRLTEALEIPFRERNALHLAAGYAPLHRERPIDDPSLAAARTAIDRLVKGHAPFPALAIDRNWTMVASNDAVAMLLNGIEEPGLLRPPVNVLRLSLHPKGLSPTITNLAVWRRHLLQRLKRQIAVTADSDLTTLMQELQAYPAPAEAGNEIEPETPDIIVPLELATPIGRLSLFSTTTVFGAPVDITLSEIAIESFFPANELTRQLLQAMADAPTDR
jgi:MmyB-like transcription regulator ligand binding domain